MLLSQLCRAPPIPTSDATLITFFTASLASLVYTNFIFGVNIMVSGFKMSAKYGIYSFKYVTDPIKLLKSFRLLRSPIRFNTANFLGH
ncbi:hypothetical protein ADUPG1_002524, partial [Aduncisulcus paluster]